MEGRTLEWTSGFLLCVARQMVRGTNPYPSVDNGYLLVTVIRDLKGMRLEDW